MGFLDRFKKKASDVGGKAKDVAEDKAPQIKDGIDKVADKVDETTKGKQTDKIETVADKAKDVVDKIADSGGDKD